MKELITVIVPIYKVEAYIHRCLQSILKQSYSNLEIILVDDGSPDMCGFICDEYAKLDERIRVIHKKNAGLSSARNAGLDVMTGSFVTFIDSDDYIALDYIEKLYLALRDFGADISVCAEEYVLSLSDGSEKIIRRPFKEFDGVKVMNVEEALSCSLRQDLYEASAWAKLYRANLFSDVRYPLGFAYEDQGTTYKTFLKSKKIVYIGEHLYFYLQRSGSILHSSGNSKRFWDGVEMVETQCEDIKKQLPQLENAANSRCIGIYFHALIGADITSDDKLSHYAWNGIKKLRMKVMFDFCARPKARCAAVLSYLGKDLFLAIRRICF